MLIKEFAVDNLRVEVYNSRQAMGAEAARQTAWRMREFLNARDEINMIFAAAPSQNEFLAALVSEPSIDWKRVNAFHMDEYIGLKASAPQLFSNFLKERLFSRVPFKSVNYINPEADPEVECERYAALLSEHKPDIICMGIGENGHIAFNDPGVALFNDPKRVKIVMLDEKCRQQQVNDGCFARIEDVPVSAITLTIPTLTDCKLIFCMVPGKTKAEAVRATLKGAIAEDCPATILRNHNRAILFVDTDSAALA